MIFCSALLHNFAYQGQEVVNHWGSGFLLQCGSIGSFYSMESDESGNYDAQVLQDGTHDFWSCWLDRTTNCCSAGSVLHISNGEQSPSLYCKMILLRSPTHYLTLNFVRNSIMKYIFTLLWTKTKIVCVALFKSSKLKLKLCNAICLRQSTLLPCPI